MNYFWIAAGLAFILIPAPTQGSPLSEYWRNQSGISAMNRHHYFKATRQFEQALESATADAKTDITFNLGSAALGAGDLETATHHLKRSIVSNDPKRRADGWYQLALTDIRANRQHDAISHLKSALMNNAAHEPARQTLLALLDHPEQQPSSSTTQPKPRSTPPQTDSGTTRQILNKLAQKETQSKQQAPQKNHPNTSDKVTEW